MENLNPTKQRFASGISLSAQSTIHRTPAEALLRAAVKAVLPFGLRKQDLQQCPGCGGTFLLEDFDAIVTLTNKGMVRASAFRSCRDCRLSLESRTRRMGREIRRNIIEEALIG